MSRQAVVAVAAPEHRVAGHATTQPRLVLRRADSDYPSRPLVTELKWEVRHALVVVRHLAGVQLDVGAADSHALDLHQQLAGGGHRILDLHDRGLAWSCDDEGAHQIPAQYGSVLLPAQRYGD